MNYFYVPESISHSFYYYGSSSNLKKRFHEHKNGAVNSTKHHRPLKVIYYEAYEFIEQARLREKQVKNSGSIRKYLHTRISINPKKIRQPGLLWVKLMRGQPGLP